MKNNKRFVGYFRSPIGTIEIIADKESLLSLKFIDKPCPGGNRNEMIRKVKNELKEYFNGRRQEFDLPLKLEGTEFQKSVWQALRNIPYAAVVSYSDVAKAIGKPAAARAVGQANNKNKLPIVIPCHRVTGKNKKLVGYAAGLWRKKWLLKHEAEHSKKK